MPGGAQPRSGDETGSLTPPKPDLVPNAGGSATETSPEPSNITAGTATPPVSTQGATNSRRGESQ